MNSGFNCKLAATAVLAGALFSAALLEAADIHGVVRSATAEYATVTTDSDLIPTPGDKVEIFFKLPGGDDEISVASGHVYEITGEQIMVQIDNATGSVAKDQLVRINSLNPKEKRTPTAAAPTPSNQTSPSSEATLASPARTLPPSIPFPTIAPKETSATSAENGVDPAAAQDLTKGMAQYSAGDIDGAIASYTSGIRVAPAVAVLYLNRANAYLFKPNFQSAIADANKALELKVEKADDAFVIRGAARAGLGEYGAAMADCNRALKINPKHALAYNNRANNKLHLRDIHGALSDCNKSIALDPSSPLPYYNRGYAYMNKGEASKAIADWNKAMQMNPAFRVELEPLVQKLRGNSQSGNSAASNAAPQTADLVNPAQKIVGTWQGTKHRKQYFGDGTLVIDPELGPNARRGQWRVEGDRLTEYSSDSKTQVVTIVSLTSSQFVVKDDQGHIHHKMRVSDQSARKGKTKR